MKGIALGISYFYEFMALPGHSWRLFKLREQRNLRAYAFIQETMADLDVVTLTYWELRKAEARADQLGAVPWDYPARPP